MKQGSTSQGTGSHTCAVVRADSTYEGKQGFSYFHGISAERVGSTGICMHLLTIPPGGRAKAHLHKHHETAIYVLSGHARMRYGEQLQHELACGPGDMIYIPAGMPHLPFNASQSEPCTAVLARTDPNEQESVVLRPDLDDCVPG
ncbi:MAG: cupin [Thermomicrobiales bacterium]|nr:MAG: cupin [Thermomicrobiales bacterium]